LKGTPKKNFRGKNMQNSARFRSTLKFGGEYLRNGSRYSKSVSYSFDNDFSCVRQSKSGEVRWSDLGNLDLELYPPKTHYSEVHILVPRGRCAPQIFTPARKWPTFTSAFSTGNGGFSYNFFWRRLKIGLKCNKWAPITSELWGVTQRNFGPRRRSKLRC